MFPVLFRIGDFPVTSFGLMMFLSFITAAFICGRQMERYGLDRGLAWDVLAWVAIGGIVGAKLYHLALNFDQVLADPRGTIFSRAGLVWYGGLIGGVVAYWLQIRARKLPPALMFDATAPALALAYAVGRMGCFLVGDDYGVPTDSWVGIAFPQGSPPSTAGYFRSIGVDVPAGLPDTAVLAVHPTQLYEVGLAIVMFAILWRLGSKLLRQGQLFSIYLALYGIERFFIEFVRAKSDRVLGVLSTSQLMSMLLIGLGVWLFFHRRTAPPVPRPTDTASAPGRKTGARPAANRA